MKRIKVGVGIVVGLVAIYGMVSFGIFYYKKPLLDKELQIVEQENSAVKNTQEVTDVVVQSIGDDEHVYQHPDESQFLSDDLIMNNDQDESKVMVVGQREENFIVSAVQNEQQKEELLAGPNSYSFVTMPAENCSIDAELLYTFDLLLGKDLDEFVRLILQSNNNIVSKQACRSCAMYAFFSKIKKHETLTVQDIKTLQPLIANLYRFVENMQKISKVSLLRPEQLHALQDLNRSQAVKNDIKLQARKAATAVALKKLQTISYR